MATFETTQRMYDVLGELFRTLMENQEVAEKFRAANLTILFNIHEPEGRIWLDGQAGVICGAASLKANITMSLSGDACHKFWLKQLTMPVALAKRQIKARGPIPKVLKLLPLLKPAYEAYPAIVRNAGIAV